MRRLLALLAAFATVAAMVVSGAGSASALGSESFGCRVSTGPAAYAKTCTNTQAASTYSVSFLVQNVSGTVSYAWHVPTGIYQMHIYAGCSTSSYQCVVTVPNADAEIDMSVTLTQGTASETLYSTAYILRYCGSNTC
jgi:hypothetical protein